MPTRVKLACLTAFILHGILILAGEYHLSYDGYNHIFFADHYLRDWWSLWETRWYTGFEVTSYPPLIHQSIALIGRLSGLDLAFRLLLWAVLTAYPLSVYWFSRIFTGPRAASYAALGAAVLPSVFLAAHTFGQLPTLVSTFLTLWGAAALAAYLQRGDALSGLLAVSLFATSMAGHHATLLFQPWLAGAVLLRPLIKQEGKRGRLLIRFGLFASLTALAGLVVVWPFWAWGLRQTIQTPIDHLSRHNFFTDPSAVLIFFLPVYGFLIPFIPLAVRTGLRKRFWGLAIVFLMMFLLGLGGTTPLPRLIFRSGWSWLTYDRFAFWASLTLLPFFGLVLATHMRRRQRRQGWSVFWVLMGVTGLVIGVIPSWLPTQPDRIDMQPIVNFLEQSDRAQYRYVTFGFGDQFALLSQLTDATTIDGSYHTTRTLPELRSSGIAQIDTAYWLPGGITALEPILQKSGEHGVRWGFVALNAYDPLLERSGWKKKITLSNGVDVWENPSAVLPPPVQPPATSPFAVFSWGAFPLLALYISTLLAIRHALPAASAKILVVLQAFPIGLLPLGLTFWYYRTLFIVEHPRIYPTYSDALIYLSDGLALAVILPWVVQRMHVPGENAAPRESIPWSKFFNTTNGWLLAICLFASLSLLWTIEWRTSLAISLQLWLGLGLYWVLRETKQAWTWFALGCFAALLVQFTAAAWEVGTQSTAPVSLLGIPNLGSLQPGMSGASVVELANGTRWLRAYGTLPHPNLLGGFGIVLLAGPLSFLLHSEKYRFLSILWFNLGLVLIVLTFSRSAWIGLAVLGLWLLMFWKNLNRKSLFVLALTSAVTLVLLFLVLHPLILTRLGARQASTEQVSTYTRLWLVEHTLELIQEHSLLGTGIGSYSLALSRQVADFYQIEPVHSLPLLVQAELGIGGTILLSGFAITIALKALRMSHPTGIAFSAVLMGLLASSLFDHYLWTLAPGRTLLAAILGIWAGQVRADEDYR